MSHGKGKRSTAVAPSPGVIRGAARRMCRNCHVVGRVWQAHDRDVCAACGMTRMVQHIATGQQLPADGLGHLTLMGRMQENLRTHFPGLGLGTRQRCQDSFRNFLADMASQALGTAQMHDYMAAFVYWACIHDARDDHTLEPLSMSTIVRRCDPGRRRGMVKVTEVKPKT